MTAPDLHFPDIDDSPEQDSHKVPSEPNTPKISPDPKAQHVRLDP